MLINLKNIILTISLSISVWASEALVGDVEKKDELHAASPLLIVDALLDAAPISPPSASVDGYANLDTVFERVIGLGRNCLTKAQINLFFNDAGKRWHETKSGKADLFDWMVIPDYDLFAQALSNKLEDFFEKDDFFIAGNYYHLLRNSKYGMRWPHILEKYLPKLPNGTQADPALLLRTFHEHFEKEKTKINSLKERFCGAINKNTLYIISRSPMLSRETLVKVRDALTVCRGGNKQFVLLAVSKDEGHANFENVMMREAGNVIPDSDVNPDPLCWQKVFHELKFTSDIWK